MSERDVRLTYARQVLVIQQRRLQRLQAAEEPPEMIDTFQLEVLAAELEVALLEFR